ncbi:MAG: hypothetical protein HFI58_00800 [Lachnospiraceae bacterium]|jgi:hypothetical protein|nr:hypothetical protein [Lachnospiraceae bacterium]
MRKNNLALYIAIGLTGLAIISLGACINQQITASLSIATLLFTIAQTIESKGNYMDEDMQNAVDVANKVGNFNYNDEMMMFFKTWMKYDTSNTKKKWIERAVIVINCVAFIVLFVGFAIPMSIPDQVSMAVSILSTALLFLSIWFVDKQQQRKEQWNEVLMLSLIGKNANQNPIQVEEAENGQTENGNP